MKRFPVIICLSLLLLLVTAAIPAVTAAEVSDLSVKPSSGPNTGTIKLTITGSGLGSATQVRMNKCKAKTGTPGGNRYGTILSKSDTSITAEFYLNEMNVGDYDIAVNAPKGGTEDWHVGYAAFLIYNPSGTTTTTKATGTTTTVKTYATESDGENSVFFETSPSGATIYVDGSEVGTSAFTYKTDMDGSHTVLVKKVGYTDYEDRVNILEGQRVRFYAQLTPLSSDSVTTTKATTAVTGTGKPGTITTTIKKSTMKMPTPLGTDPPATEESPVDPTTALWAAAFAFAYVVIRRR